MDDNKKKLILSIINFIKNESKQDGIEEDTVEGLEVALQCLEQAYGIDDSSQPCPDLVEIFNEHLKKNTAATTSAERPVTEEDKSQAEVLKLEGNNLVKAERYQEAVECYTKAIHLDGQNAVYYCNRAAAYTKLGDSNNAILDCETAISIDPNYSKAYGRLGLVHLNNKKYEEAVKYYEKAVVLEPTNNSYKSNLNMAKEQLQSPRTPAGAAAANPQMNPLAGLDLSSLLSNPAVMNMAQSFMQNPQMQNMFASMMGGAPPPSQPENVQQNTNGSSAQSDGPGFQMPAGLDLSNIMNAAQQFGEQMRQENPEVVEDLRSQFQQGPQPDLPRDNKDDQAGGTS